MIFDDKRKTAALIVGMTLTSVGIGYEWGFPSVFLYLGTMIALMGIWGEV